MSLLRSRLAVGVMGAVRTVGVMALLSTFCGVLVAGLLIPVTTFVGVTSHSVADGFQNLPLALRDTPTAQRSKVLDSDGEVLAYFYSQNRQDVSLEQIAPVMRQAMLSIEDYRFYEHGALDVKGTLRALINNATDGSTQGGSTITQQLVKQILVQRAKNAQERAAATEVSPARKIRELKYAMSYEEQHTKDEILENYFNIAYFGDGAYGISAAARHYFSVSPDELDARQAATLAGLVKNPVRYDPTSYPENALDRRNTVLATMESQGELRRKVSQKALKAPLGLDITAFSNGCVSSPAAFSCDYVRRWLMKDDALGDTPAERRNKLETGGLTIQTTIDMRIQKATDAAVTDRVAPTDQAIGAQAVVEPGTGKVLALSQSRPMGNKRDSGQTYINYAVPKKYGGSNGFQAGSTFKAFTAAAALDKGYPASTTYLSPLKKVMPAGSYTTCDGGGTGKWNVRNSTGAGTFTMTKGLQQSVNTYFAQLEKLTGLCSTTTMAEKLGLKFPSEDEVGPFTLGVSDTSPLALSAAYATFPARGRYCEPQPVTAIANSSGNVIQQYGADCERVMEKATADTINEILAGVQSLSGFGAKLQLDIPSAAKTGTTTNNRAVWYMGYTPAAATSSMIAGANRFGQPLSLANKSLNGSFIAFDAVGGSSLAGPMWYNAMSVIQDYLPDKSFVPPTSLGPPPADMPTVPTTAPPTPSSSVSPAPPTTGGGFPGFPGVPGNGGDPPGNGGGPPR